jgi:mono/diheme cytochrome c family protein
MTLRWILIAAFLSGPALADHALLNRDLEAGKTLYGAHCASCHGANLEGQPNWRQPDADGVLPAPPHDETGHTWHHDDRLLFDYTRLGGQQALAQRGVEGFNSGMPGFAGVLSDAQILDILGYIRSTWPKRVQQMQSSRNPPHG